jgi:hypothetical protein
MSDCPYHLTPEDTGERRRRTDLRIRLLGGHLREAVKVMLFSGGFTLRRQRLVGSVNAQLRCHAGADVIQLNGLLIRSEDEIECRVVQ